ncbi:MAG TPA: TlpA family protein disulfide reductase [Sideroxyarcus sp.]|nr:TlpA family protein disulfide reductase [Sideroxyarcus sp.]
MKRWLLFAGLALLTVSAAQAAELKPFVRDSHRQIVVAHSGKPFIVTFWSVNCSYCGGELALLRKLLQQHRDIGLVLVSTDTQAEAPLIGAALGKLGLGDAESWVFADSHVERLRFAIDREWYGELPRTYFHTAQSGVWAASGQLEPATVERWIKQQTPSR